MPLGRSPRAELRGRVARRAALALAALVPGAVAVSAAAAPVSAAAPALAGVTRRALADPLARVEPMPVLPPGARAAGPLDGRRALRLGLSLAPRDPAGLAAYAAGVSTPGSPEYHRYLTTAGFAARFGPTVADVAAVEREMRTAGLDVTGLSANKLILSVSGVAARVESAFHTRLTAYALPGGGAGWATATAPRLPAAVASDVQSVLGLDELAMPRSELRRAPVLSDVVKPSTYRASISPVAPGAPRACSAASLDALGGGGWSDDQMAHAYGLDSLYARGDLGAGQTIALFELEPFSMSDLATFDRCYFGASHAAEVSTVRVDGFDLVGPGSGESILDLEDLSALAPKAHIVVYEAPNTTFGGIDEYNTIVSQDRANIVSTSWGECEQALQTGAPGAQQLESYIFEEAATQGQTVVSAAGDTGSDDCAGTQFSNTKAVAPYLSVDDPASQPYVLAAGGTSLLSDTNPPSEVVWNHGAQWGGGGGGVSTTWQIPAWQAASGVPGVATSGGREVPDVSASADEWRGVTVFSSTFAPPGGKSRGLFGTPPSGWTMIGGTSSAAPQWAAVLAEIADSGGSCATLPVTRGGRDLGFVSPELYAVASDPTTYAQSFTDVTSGNNDVFGLGLGYSATPGYDLASGLGSPTVVDAAGSGGLASSLCAVASGAAVPSGPPSVTAVSPRSGPVTGGTAVTLTGSGFPAGDPGAVAVSFGSQRATVVSVTATTLAVTAPRAGLAPATAPVAGAGRVDVVVTVRTPTSSQSSAASPAATYEYVATSASGTAVPTVAGIGPSGGNVAGGGTVTVYGSGFRTDGPISVTFGGVPARQVEVVSDTELRAVVPRETSATACATGNGFDPSAACQVEVVVASSSAQSPVERILPALSGPVVFTAQGVVAPTPETEVAPAATEYDYAPLPRITSVTPDPADSTGTTPVTITGSGFDLDTFDWVNFGPAKSSASEQTQISAISPTSITIVPPPSPNGAGSVLPGGVSVQTAGGLSNVYPLSYAGVPRVGSLSVLGGPSSGGTAIVVKGSDMAGVRSVRFVSEVASGYGASTSAVVSAVSATSLHVVAPSDLPGPVDVEPCTASGCAPPDPKVDTFVYFTPGRPSLSTVTPRSGPASGGTRVVMFGDNLDGALAVRFGKLETRLLASTRDYPDGDPFVLVADATPGPAGTTVPVTVVTRTGIAQVAGGIFHYVASAPAPPRAVHVALTGSRATVRWQAPASDGGSPVTAYTVVALAAGQAPAGGTVPASTHSLVIGRIASDHLYTFRVVASNLAHGRGTWASVGPLGATLGRAGYRLAAASGSVAGFGSLANLGGIGGSLASSAVTAIAGTPGGLGYWLATSDGSVYAFGDAYPYPYVHPVARVVGIAPTPAGDGYWEVTSAGDVYAFGHARSYGRPGGRHVLRGRVVGIASTADGLGYYVATSAGAVYGRGDAKVVGSAVGRPGGPLVAIATVPAQPGRSPGYWLLMSSGAVYHFGSARSYGSAPLGGPAVGLAATPDGHGSWVVSASGAVRAFGDAHFEGRPPSRAGGYVGIATG